MAEKQILVIEDNAELGALLEMHLSDQSWAVENAADGRKGLKRALSGEHDLIVLDIMLPGMDGMEILRRLRSKDSRTPVIMLTSKSSEIDRVLGLEMGADDYVTKPFSIREVIARIKAVFRRTGKDMSGSSGMRKKILQNKSLMINTEKRLVHVDGSTVDLTAREYDLLLFFIEHPGRVFNRQQLLDRVWGYGHDGYAHTVNSNINRLRAKIEKDPARPEYILTVWGVGYKFRDES